VGGGVKEGSRERLGACVTLGGAVGCGVEVGAAVVVGMLEGPLDGAKVGPAVGSVVLVGAPLKVG
jgi:hypothetical protein